MPRLVLAFPVFLVLAGCGTISRGTSADVVIDVTPADATVRTSHGPACFGSCTVRASRSQDFTVTASAPGYETQVVEVKRRVSLAGAGGVARNALAGRQWWASASICIRGQRTTMSRTPS